MTVHAPFTEDDLVRINKSLTQLKSTEEIIKRSKIAGIDVKEQEKTLIETKDRLNKLKQAFFPGR